MNLNASGWQALRTSLLEAFRKECAANVDEASSSLSVNLDQLFALVPMGADLVSTAKQFLAASHPSFDFYAKQLKQFDARTVCGLVWASNYIAYRCRTCGISPCMSLCADCFEAGRHRAEKHDFSMFRSQAGGACDCGDSSVLKVDGFCTQHGPANAARRAVPPDALKLTATRILPRVISRLIVHLRMVRRGGQLNSQFDDLCAFLVALSELGSVTIDAVSRVLCDSNWYCATLAATATRSEQERARSCELYREAIAAACAVPRTEASGETEAHRTYLRVEHSCALDELTFWLIRYTLHQPMINFLLSYLPSDAYKHTFSFTFVRHYALLAKALAKALHSRDLNYDLHRDAASPDAATDTDSLDQFGSAYEDDEQPVENVSARTLAHRIVHVSVQLLSNEQLVTLLLTDAALLERILAALRILFELERTLEPCKLSHIARSSLSLNLPQTVDTSKRLLRKHAYWCIVSDLINVLTHRSAVDFLVTHGCLLSELLRIVAFFQAMGINHRELHVHVEFEPDTYFVAFLAEFEVCAAPMFSVYGALADGAFPTMPLNTNASLDVLADRVFKVRSVVNAIDAQLTSWLSCLGVHCEQREETVFSAVELTFHLPLQRYLALFLALRFGIADAMRRFLQQHANSLAPELLDRLTTLFHSASEPALSAAKYAHFVEPVLFTLSGLMQVQNGLWVRNGSQIRNQAITYQQAHFNEAMIDLDLTLAQAAAANLKPDRFVGTLLDRLLVRNFLRLAADRPHSSPSPLLDAAQADSLLEALCVLLCWLVTEPRGLLTTPTDSAHVTGAIRRELVAALCVADRTHSHALEHAPDRCGTARDARELAEAALRDIADYRAPAERDANGALTQGTYSLRGTVWTCEFDPAHTLLRCAYRADYQRSLERYLERAGSEQQRADARRRGVSLTNFWPPLRVPSYDAWLILPEPLRAGRLLRSSTFHALAFIILHRALLHNANVAAVAQASAAASQRDTLVYIVHLLRVSVALQGYEQTQPVQSDAADEPTNSESVFDLELENWYPADICEDVFKCLVHTIGNVQSSRRRGCKVVAVNESILTLLGKAYRRFADIDYCTPRGVTKRDQLFPTGADVIGTLLDTVYTSSVLVARRMDTLFASGAPAAAADPPAAAAAGVDKKQAARDRQRRLLESMANKQQAFLAKLVTNDTDSSQLQPPQTQAMDTERPDTPVDEQTVYSCVICNSSDDAASVVGLIALAQPTVLTLQRRAVLSTANSDGDCEPQPDADMLPLTAEAVARRDATCWRSLLHSAATRLAEKVDDSFALFSGVGAAPMAVHVRSCGHYVHASCLKAYRDTLEQSGVDYVRQAYRIDVRANEFQCPLCRQLANSLIPVLRPMRHSQAGTTPTTPLPPSTSSQTRSGFFSIFRRSSSSAANSNTKSTTRQYASVARQPSLSGSAYASAEWPPALAHCDVLQRIAALRAANARPRDLEAVLLGAMGSVFEACAGSQQQNACANAYHSACAHTLNEWTRLVDLRAAPFYKSLYFSEAPRVPAPFAAATVRHAVEYELALITADYETHVTVSAARRLATLRHVIAAAQTCTRPHVRAYARLFERLNGYARPPDDVVSANDPFSSVLLCEPVALFAQLMLAAFAACALDAAVIDALARVCTRLAVVRALLAAILMDARAFVHAMTNADWRALAQARVDGSVPPGVANARGRVGPAARTVLDQLVSFVKLKLFDQIELECLAAQQQPMHTLSLQDALERVRSFANETLAFNLRRLAVLRHAVGSCASVSPTAALNNLFSEFDNARTVEQLVAVLFEPDDDEQDSHMQCDVLELVLGGAGSNASACVAQWLLDVASFNLADLRLLLNYETPSSYALLSRAPSFVALPRSYDTLFQCYTRARCVTCNAVPSDPLVCLACGALVCMSSKCCSERRGDEDVHEAVLHAARCGAGSMVCLSVNSTSVIVLSGARICIWGSLYLDEHGEEDRDLKRGRPLFLKDERFELLTKQWRTHSFDEACKNWVWHENRY